MASVAVLVGLASCATPTKPLTPDAGKQLNKIALLEVQAEDQYGASNLYLEGIFGGGLVNIQHSKEFTTVLRQRGFSITRVFVDDLTSALTAAGFEVERVEATRQPYPFQGKVTSHAKTNADALLNISIGAGYVSVHGVDDYIPRVIVRAELLENKTGQEGQLYLENYCYGYKPSFMTAIEIEAPPTYKYGSFDKLMQSNVEASEGLQTGAALISEKLAKQISSAKR
jgi:hypothetical protein